MANQSTFPTQIDNFQFHTEILASDVPLVKRFQELKLKESRTTAEEIELGNLTLQLRNKLLSADDFNKFQDALVNMEVFIRDEVTTTIETNKNAALIAIDQKLNTVIVYLDGTTAGQLRNDIGVMGNLATTVKTSLVEAVNELKAGINNVIIPIASTTVAGIVQLNNTATSTSTTQAPTANALKAVNDSLTAYKAETATLTTKGHTQLSSSVTSTSEMLSATPKAVKTAMDRADAAFLQASEGKTAVASAITAKGVAASPSDTFPTLASKIGQISTGKSFASGGSVSIPASSYAYVPTDFDIGLGVADWLSSEVCFRTSTGLFASTANSRIIVELNMAKTLSIRNISSGSLSNIKWSAYGL